MDDINGSGKNRVAGEGGRETGSQAQSRMRQAVARGNTPTPENLYSVLWAGVLDVIEGNVDRRDAMAVKGVVMGQVAVARNREALAEMSGRVEAARKAGRAAELRAELAALESEDEVTKAAKNGHAA